MSGYQIMKTDLNKVLTRLFSGLNRRIFAAMGLGFWDDRRMARMSVVWKEEYALGYELIDAGHRLVVEAINRLDDACTGDRVREILDMLDAQLGPQFQHEEALMMVSRSDRLEEQRLQHRRLLDTLGRLRERCEAGERIEHLLKLNLAAFVHSHLRGTDVEEFGAEPVRWVA